MAEKDPPEKLTPMRLGAPPEHHVLADEYINSIMSRQIIDMRTGQPQQRGKTELPKVTDGGYPGGLSNWNERHQDLVKKANSTNPDYAFYGDSITEAMHLNNDFKRLFNGKAENFGIHNDRIDNLKYRLLDGEASFAGGRNPEHVVLHIGTNDLGKKSPEDIAKGILEDASILHSKLPDSKLLVVGLMPRPGFDSQIQQVNSILQQRIQQLQDSHVAFADIGPSMPKGAPGIWQPGGLHPTFKVGYSRMLGAMRQAIDDN